MAKVKKPKYAVSFEMDAKYEEDDSTPFTPEFVKQDLKNSYPHVSKIKVTKV